ncbi:MAG: ATP-grasp domain [Candidatus Parcubacteria bacterium]|jgi:hypothetical protein
MSLVLKKPLIYVTRDIERALGMVPTSNYFIVSNDTAYGREIKAQHPENVWLHENTLESGDLDTYDLLLLPEVQKIIDTHDADVVVFQNTPRIERLAQQMHWNLLNPSAELGKKVEEKISQIAWLGTDANLLPPNRVALVKDVVFENKKFVLQFNHTHTGQGTYIITSSSDLEPLKAKFPERECRIVDFIEGPVYTVNASVNRFAIIVGSPSYQITGLSPFTDLPFSTIGNDWSIISKEDRKEIARIAHVIGLRLKKDSWRGLFGVDVIKDAVSGKIYLLEINARQAASTVFESTLQKSARPKSLTIFETHISALLKKWMPLSTTQINSGAQIVERVTNVPHRVNVSALKEKGFTVIEYKNVMHNKELFRIQSSLGIMESHNTLNQSGKFIASCIQ